MRAILTSLKRGSSIEASCSAANVSVVSFWTWRKRDARLDELVKSIYESRVAIVEDVLYETALDGNTTAQIFFLKNRAVDRWRDRNEHEAVNVTNTVYNIQSKELLSKDDKELINANQRQHSNN